MKWQIAVIGLVLSVLLLSGCPEPPYPDQDLCDYITIPGYQIIEADHWTGAGIVYSVVYDSTDWGNGFEGERFFRSEYCNRGDEEWQKSNYVYCVRLPCLSRETGETICVDTVFDIEGKETEPYESPFPPGEFFTMGDNYREVIGAELVGMECTPY